MQPRCKAKNYEKAGFFRLFFIGSVSKAAPAGLVMTFGLGKRDLEGHWRPRQARKWLAAVYDASTIMKLMRLFGNAVERARRLA